MFGIDLSNPDTGKILSVALGKYRYAMTLTP